MARLRDVELTLKPLARQALGMPNFYSRNPANIPPPLPRQHLSHSALNLRWLLFVSVLLLACLHTSAFAKPPVTVKAEQIRAEETTQQGTTLLLPYFFKTEDMGLNWGIGGMRRGFYQEQFTVGATVFNGDSRAVAAGMWDLRLPYSDRLYFSAIGMTGRYPVLKAYAERLSTALPSGEARPGSNDSSIDSYFTARGDSAWADLKLEYVLPIGSARKQGWLSYKTKRGQLISAPSGGNFWNPLRSGVSVLALRYTSKSQTYQREELILDGDSRAYELGLLYDNTDYPNNPSVGSSQYFAWSQNAHSSDFDWSFMQMETAKYLSFGASSYAIQRTLAMNLWLAYSPSWRYQRNEQGEIFVEDAPPFVEGATLGGFYRLRGFDNHRFHDKAALYSALEYRYTLAWNPTSGIKVLNFLKLDWLQLVPFVELGRVAPEFSSTLFEDIKTSYGLGLRAMAAGVVLRLDIAHSTEGNNIWVMVDHPF